MKTLLIISLILISSYTNAQTFKIDSTLKGEQSKLPFCLIDSIVKSNNSKAQLYSNALSLLLSPSKGLRLSISLKDAELGQIFFDGNYVKEVTESFTDKKGKIQSLQGHAGLYFKGKLYIKDNKFKIVLYNLEYPFSADIDTGVNLPVQLPGKTDSERSRFARELASDFITNTASKINSKSENDF